MKMLTILTVGLLMVFSLIFPIKMAVAIVGVVVGISFMASLILSL